MPTSADTGTLTSSAEVTEVATDDGILGDLGEMSWSELQGASAEIRGQLNRADDPATREVLGERLAEAREAIALIESRWRQSGENGDGPPEDGRAADVATSPPEGQERDGRRSSSVDELLDELLPRGEEIEPSSPDPEIIEKATTTARRRIFDTATGTGHRLADRAPNIGHQPRIEQVASKRHQPISDFTRGVEHQRNAQTWPALRSSTALRVAGALALAALVGIAGILLQASREQPAEVAATAGGSVDSAHELEELQEILTIIGLDDLALELDGSLVRISGTVESADQLEMVRDAAVALADYAELDTSGVVIGQPSIGVSESTSPVGTDRPEPTLQRDLDRLLTLTPIMFDPGRSELGEIDRQILNAVAAVIMSAPKAEVTIIGHADDDGAGNGNVDLATTRAETVHDYLAFHGVREDLLTAEGSAGATPSEIPGSIELDVTLEEANPRP